MNSNSLIKRNTLSAAITAALLASGQAVMAQEQTGDTENSLLMEEIIVTATRRESSIVDVPYNISAVSGDFLQSGQILTTAEMLRGVPGAQMVDIGARNNGVANTIRIRGLSVDSTVGNADVPMTSVPPVSTYINDTPIYANLILKDLERVEILRGPQGTLYGSGSLGGTVRYITRRPVLGEFEGYVSGSFSQTKGSDGYNWDVDAVINFPMGDTFAARLVAGKVDYDGIIDLPNAYVLDSNGFPVAPDGILAETAVYEHIEDADTIDIEFARLTLLWEPNDRFNAQLTYSYQNDDIGGRMHVTRGNDGWGDPYGKYEIGSVQREPSSREVNALSLEMDIDLGFATLTSSTSGYEHEGDSISENTGFSAQRGWLADYYYNYPRPMHSAERTYSDEAFTQELRLVSNTDGAVDWIIGAFYQDQDQQSVQGNYIRNFKNWRETEWECCVISDSDFRYNKTETFKDKAVFGELTWHVNEKFRLTGGFRYFDLDYENHTFMGVGLYTFFGSNDEAQFEDSDSDTLFKFNASYDVSDNAMLYGTISEGFRRGGTNAVPLTGIFAESPAWLRYGPDFTTNYELGIKGTGNQSFYNVSLFYVDWKDIQLNTATGIWGFYAAQNGNDAHTQGVEIEYDKSFGKGWRMNAGYTYTKGELDEDFLTADGFLTAGFKGQRLPGVSEHTVNVMLENVHQMNNGWEWMNRVSAYYQSDVENATGASERLIANLGSFSIWNFNSNLYINNWTLGFFVKNIFNEEGIVGLWKEENMGTSPEQNYFGNGAKTVITRPRTIGVNVTYNF